MAKPDPFEEAVQAIQNAQSEYQRRIEAIKRELESNQQKRSQRGRDR